MHRLPTGLFALALLAAPAAASAGEGESALSLSLSYGTYLIDTLGPPGLVSGLDYERGLTDSLWLRFSVGSGYFFGEGNALSAHGVAGITYAFDVLKYVPYANLGVGAMVLNREPRPGQSETKVRPLIEIGFGVDVLASRSFSYGIVARFASFASDIGFFLAGVRGTYRWGFF
jgi:hypothetical protein